MQAFRPLPGSTSFAIVTNSPVGFSAPSFVGDQAQGFGTANPIRPFNSVRITNHSDVGVIFNITGANATTAACDGAVPPRSVVDIGVPVQSGSLSIATVAGSTHITVSFGNIR